MSKEEKRAPEVRFEGFHDDWKQRKLGESLSILKDGTHGTHKNVENGPHLLSAKNIKNGKIKVTEDDRKISQKEYEQIHKNFQLKSGDILLTIVGSIGEAAVLQDPTGITFQRSVAYLRSSEIDTYFLYTLFIGPDFQKELKNRQVVSAQPGIYLGDISKIIVKIPKGMKEQKQIGKFFKQLNNAIALHQEKITKLQALKKAALQSLFPEKGEIEPKVRFANFKSKWSQRQLGETLIERNIQQTQSIEYPLVSFTVQDGVTPKTERYNRQQLVRGSKKDKKYKVTEFNDIVYNPANLKFGAIARNKYGKAVLSPIYVTFRVNQEIVYPSYIEMTVTNPDFIKYSLRYQQGTVYERQSVNPEDLLSLYISIPEKEEQSDIGLFFEQLNNDVELYKSKLEKLQRLKKSFLQRMFI